MKSILYFKTVAVQPYQKGQIKNNFDSDGPNSK
jgi:hypothetical protein